MYFLKSQGSQAPLRGMAVGLMGLLTLLGAPGCASIPSSERLAPRTESGVTTEEILPVLDAHTHATFAEPTPVPLGLRQASEQEYFEELASIGAVGAVSHSLLGVQGIRPDLRKRGVIFCAGVGKRVRLAELKRALASGNFGCIKIYLGYVPRYAYDKAYLPVYRLALQYDVPVVFHTGDTATKDALIKYADPLTLDEVAVAFPKMTMVIAHCGNPWIQSAAEVAYKNANVFLEGSAFLVGDLSKLPPADVETYMVEPLRWIFGYVGDPKKLLFGSDWPLVTMRPYFEAFKRAIPREHWRDVFYENARRVFRIR